VFAQQHVQVYLTGDLHHYRRHEELLAPGATRAPVQKITAGGGGAFLHPTHEEDLSTIREVGLDPATPARTFRLRKSYPDERRSQSLAFGNLFFFFKNPKAGLVPAILYLITAWLVGSTATEPSGGDPWKALGSTVDRFTTQPSLALWMMGSFALFLAFTDTHSKLYRLVAGTVHCAAHWIALFYIGWGTFDLAAEHLGTGIVAGVVTGLSVFAGGWVVGSILLGSYLLVSVNIFGRHSEEAYSALRIQDYKHFLRMHFSADGSLKIYPIKLEKVPRRWRPRVDSDASPSQVQPVDALRAELIEGPILVN
jgi:hypothetical protein